MVDWNKLELHGRYKTVEEAKNEIKELKTKKIKAVYIYEPFNINKYIVYIKHK